MRSAASAAMALLPDGITVTAVAAEPGVLEISTESRE